jgi:hypothetical protein
VQNLQELQELQEDHLDHLEHPEQRWEPSLVLLPCKKCLVHSRHRGRR